MIGGTLICRKGVVNVDENLVDCEHVRLVGRVYLVGSDERFSGVGDDRERGEERVRVVDEDVARDYDRVRFRSDRREFEEVLFVEKTDGD